MLFRSVHFAAGEPLQEWWATIVWVSLVFATGYLEVSTWRFYSFKDIDLKRQHPFVFFILLIGLIAAIISFSGPVLFAIAIAYTLSGVLARLTYAIRRSSPPPPPAEMKPV